MKIQHYWVDDAESKNRCVHINLVAESQKDAADLIEMCNAMPKSIQAYGAVNKDSTWAWFKIPMKRIPRNKQYFGNTDM